MKPLKTLCKKPSVATLALLLLVAHSVSSIRVDWNTNTGPIVPPTSTPAPVPQPPFRDPAPVWEDQSDDIPNPNPYRYILPPPSRPKYNDITLEQRKQHQQQHQAQPVQPTNPTPIATSTVPTGKIIDKPQQPQPTYQNSNDAPQNRAAAPSQPQQHHQQQQPQIVPSLAVQYVPNKGLKYYAVVPRHTEVTYGSDKQTLLETNDLYHNEQQQLQSKYDKYDKLNGKYNPKLKKYKAYEKVKYMPYIVYYDPTRQQFFYTSVPSKMVLNNSL
ncbi:uncharacterized protein LOC131294385 [Anopheles ziemanni]|uniref:uncharacterized protein LOC131265052 n=1 Tax=Anopheles coustani TaxID=139045 RepID=UPI00265883C8|nr:uncharacterized protein LOC131265052 [Anopheles coustani]XP_058178416.1 uncharacterized protein LOC131294385 [Anopheles ziemanni]